MIAKFQKIETLVTNSKWTIFVLVTCGFVSAVLGLLAYAPADGADAADYYLHAALLAGEEVPAGFGLHSPLLPLLILFFRYGLGTIYGLIVLQYLLSVFQALLFYWALREYDTRFAFLSAILICFDMQVKVLNSFVSTEPLYIFLSSLAFALLMRQIRRENRSWKEPQDWFLGLVLALLVFSRSVGRYLILPFGLSFLLFTRSWKRSLILWLVYYLCLQVFFVGYGAFAKIDNQELKGSANDDLLSLPLFRGGLLDAINGPASAELAALAGQCEESIPIRCMVAIRGQEAVFALINRALVETMRGNPIDYSIGVLRHVSMYLSLSGQQYHELSPAQVQCEDTTARAERNFQLALEGEWLTLNSVSLDLDAFRQTVAGVTGIMCPPWYENTRIRFFVDTIASLYQIIALPYAYIFYALLALSVISFPFARHYLPIVCSCGLILFYHTAISALIFNVQARYVVVVNPYRILLFVMLLYIVAISVRKAVKAWKAKTDYN